MVEGSKSKVWYRIIYWICLVLYLILSFQTPNRRWSTPNFVTVEIFGGRTQSSISLWQLKWTTSILQAREGVDAALSRPNSPSTRQGLSGHTLLDVWNCNWGFFNNIETPSYQLTFWRMVTGTSNPPQVCVRTDYFTVGCVGGRDVLYCNHLSSSGLRFLLETYPYPKEVVKTKYAIRVLRFNCGYIACSSSTTNRASDFIPDTDL